MILTFFPSYTAIFPYGFIRDRAQIFRTMQTSSAAQQHIRREDYHWLGIKMQNFNVEYVSMHASVGTMVFLSKCGKFHVSFKRTPRCIILVFFSFFTIFGEKNIEQ